MSPQICKTLIAIIIYVLKDTEREQQNLEKVRPWLIKSAFPSHPDNVVCETLAKILTTEKAGGTVFVYVLFIQLRNRSASVYLKEPHDFL